MNDSTPFSLEGTDLSNLLRPSWVKDAENKTSSVASSFKHDQAHQGSFSSRHRKTQGDASLRQSSRSRTQGNFSNHRGQGREEKPSRRDSIASRKPVTVQGWDVQIYPQDRAIDGFAKQIKADTKAYPLFELSRLILAKMERFRVRFVARGSSDKNFSTHVLDGLNSSVAPARSSTSLFHCLLDETLWLSEKDAVAHILKQHRDRFYKTEHLSVEPPKGDYRCVAVCGLSQTVLGPPNHHEYSSKLLRLHAEKFPNLSFELFKSRLQMSHDEALLQQWKEEQSHRDEYSPLVCDDGSESKKITTLTDLEEHFKKHYAAAQITEVGREIMLSGVAVLSSSDPLIKRLVKDTVGELNSFPAPLSHVVGQELAARGLQIFKAHENIIYAAVARPRILNRTTTTVAPNLLRVLNVLESSNKKTRAEQWKELLESCATQGSPQGHETTLAKDLSWLIHEGYIMNYASRGFEVVV